jgi:hypothetical protein
MSATTGRLVRTVQEALDQWARRETGNEPQMQTSAIHHDREEAHGAHITLSVVDEGMGHYSREEYDVIILLRNTVQRVRAQ